MTTPQLLEDLKREEGLRLRAYRDTLGVLTIGYGHTGPDLHDGLVWSQARAFEALAHDLQVAISTLNVRAPWWRKLDDVRQDVLADMVFNMGWRSPDGRHGLSSFHDFLEYVQAGKYAAAALEMLNSLWARQVGERARRLSRMMLTGARPGGQTLHLGERG
jgi:lysozyme